jgi:ABC-type glutathione transport system ATPase component
MVYPEWDADLAASLLADFDLPAKRSVKKLSRGMTSAVGIVLGLASRAPLTLFDEPYLGLDAVARQLFYDRLIADYAEHPRTVVLSTHLIEEIAGLLERVLLIDRGRVLLDADAESLRDSAVTVTPGRARRSPPSPGSTSCCTPSPWAATAGPSSASTGRPTARRPPLTAWGGVDEPAATGRRDEPADHVRRPHLAPADDLEEVS